MLLIIKTGSSIPDLVARRGDFEDWIAQGLGLPHTAMITVDVTKGESLPSPGVTSGVVISGSHAMVTEHQAWSEHTAQWLYDAVKTGVPILGICYGHQLLAYALGGDVGDNPNGREFGTVDVRLHANGDPLFAGFDSRIQAHVSHTQSVLKLPEGARGLAASVMEPHAAVAFAPRVWGVQFHPEFDADIVRAYIHAYADILRAEGQDPAQCLATCHDTPVGTLLLRKFARLVMPQ
ncbi:MAG TPA: glutamine amidotransferase [Anaerolineae bacterium]|nr:glutamine amidotransferase [Anaerolineae bacterium]HQK15203.1 glutamine amidotransferase [Anaerolineae bacterium]